mmetsp:Transcript_83648/g.194490  ORF Transcript_83648/g.194490 Transcript_83648/m.194490 type:complete len:217 (-) Transcript_83648:426-1076(-)
MNVAEIGMPLVLRPKTLPMEIFQPKCQPSAKPNLPPVNMTLSPAATPPTKMLTMLCSREPPGERRCMATKKPDSASTASEKAMRGRAPRCAAKASARLCSIQPRNGNSSFSATLRWKTTSQNIQRAKLSDRSKTSKSRKKRTQPASSSTTRMKNTIPTPTRKPRPLSTSSSLLIGRPSDVSDRLSIHRHVQQTTSDEARFMPTRMQASLQRCRPVT